MDDSIASLATFLYALGAVLAIAGPAIAAFRLVGKYREAKRSPGGYDAIDALGKPEIMRPAALRDAAWGVLEFSFVALGVVSASIASLILIP